MHRELVQRLVATPVQVEEGVVVADVVELARSRCRINGCCLDIDGGKIRELAAEDQAERPEGDVVGISLEKRCRDMAVAIVVEIVAEKLGRQRQMAQVQPVCQDFLEAAQQCLLLSREQDGGQHIGHVGVLERQREDQRADG